MDDNQLSPEEAQQVWNEEASRLDTGGNPLAAEAKAAVPEIPPQQDNQPETPAAEAQPAEEPHQPEQPADPWAGLPEELKAKIAKIDQLEQANAQLLHHVKTAEGRVAAMQREFQQARTAQQAVAPNQAPSQGQMAAASKNPEKWEQLKTDFPEWASAMEEYVAAKLGSVSPQQQGVDPQAVAQFVHQQVAQTKAEMVRAIEEARIEGKYDNWKDVVNTTDFVQWFAVQSPEVRALAESSSARDAIRMLDLFHEAKKRSAADIKQERGQRLAAAATTRPGQTPPPKALDDMSPEELWNFEARKREKERAERGY